MVSGGNDEKNSWHTLPRSQCSAASAIAQDHNDDHDYFGQDRIKHVLLISVDRMHAVDFANCANGISGVNNGQPYCTALAALSKTGINYVAASTSKPSDSFTPSLLSSACTRPLISSRIPLTSSIGNPLGSLSGQSSRRKPGT
jgi:hypothetical protein